MPDGFPNKPKILRGAFVEHGLSLPPLFVVFQFNPIQLTRNRSLTYAVPNPPPEAPAGGTAAPGTQISALGQTALRQFHNREEFSDLTELQKQQVVTVQEESIGFENMSFRERRTNGANSVATLQTALELSRLSTSVSR